MAGSRSWIGGVFHRLSNKRSEKFLDYPLTPIQEQRLQKLQERIRIPFDETRPDHQTRKVSTSKPAAGICSRCGGGASVADMKISTRFCYVPFYWKCWRAIICTFCGAILRSYR